MASHHETAVHEQKPVSFTVPLILAMVTLVIMFAFLSMCDPQPHGEHHEAHGGAPASHAAAPGH